MVSKAFILTLFERFVTSENNR